MNSRRVGGDLYYPWLAVAALCAWLMWVAPGDETIPYHFAFAAFALMYGLGSWSLRRAIIGLALFSVGAGGILLARAAAGVIPWEETSEIPLMVLIMAFMVWHMRRRQIALAAITVMAQRERALAQGRERLTRLTSHEMRTPLTIARGYLELLLSRELDPDQRRDLAVVDDELDRLTRVTERLVRVIRLQGDADVEPVDLDLVLRQTAERWGPVADRRWVVEAQAGMFEGSAEQMRACLDTLIENALRYTNDGDTVRLTGFRRAEQVVVGVADSGTGMSAAQFALINALADGEDDDSPRDELSQTGLGLGLVRGVVTARGGVLIAGPSPEGGTLILMRFPARRPVRPPPIDSAGGSTVVMGPTASDFLADATP